MKFEESLELIKEMNKNQETPCHFIKEAITLVENVGVLRNNNG